jgi:hypothetical protein
MKTAHAQYACLKPGFAKISFFHFLSPVLWLYIYFTILIYGTAVFKFFP